MFNCNYLSLTKSGERYEASNHEYGMQVELLCGFIRPGEAPTVEHDPEECQDQYAYQQNGR